jgi:hypothetical protein
VLSQRDPSRWRPAPATDSLVTVIKFEALVLANAIATGEVRLTVANMTMREPDRLKALADFRWILAQR